jgi:hypothetical protein
MDVALRNAAPLRPEIALAKAISEFESSLTKEHKSNFRSFRTQALSASPSAEDVMRFTASLNSQIQKSSAAHRCFGTRFTNIMQCVQKYAALGDVVVGGSQNIIACGVWALVRLTIQVRKKPPLLYEISRSLTSCRYALALARTWTKSHTSS